MDALPAGGPGTAGAGWLPAREIGECAWSSGSFGTSQRPTSDQRHVQHRAGRRRDRPPGAYPLSLAQWLFGTPDLVQAIGTIGATGVDEDAAFQLRYAGDVIGSFFVSVARLGAGRLPRLGHRMAC